jgi:hypothetical protein
MTTTNTMTATLIQFRNGKVFEQYLNQSIESCRLIVAERRECGIRDTFAIEVGGASIEILRIK